MDPVTLNMHVLSGGDPHVSAVMKWYFLCLPGDFMVVTLFFNVSRRFGFVAFQNYVPSSVTTMLSWVSFWIKKDSAPARTSLGKWVIHTNGHRIAFSRVLSAV